MDDATIDLIGKVLLCLVPVIGVVSLLVAERRARKKILAYEASAHHPVVDVPPSEPGSVITVKVDGKKVATIEPASKTGGVNFYSELGPIEGGDDGRA